jgi:ubiquinone/menaquinone biosynthesis C-methylase UbiE
VVTDASLERPREFQEPYFSAFCQLLRAGAGSIDIHDAARSVAYAAPSRASDSYLATDIARVETHRTSAGDLLAEVLDQELSVLDVGCGTGACSVGLAISRLKPAAVLGIDVESGRIDAARQRALGYGLPQVTFQTTQRDARLPFADASFDLAVSISVLEFISTDEARIDFLREMKRVVRPGGHVYLSTPNRVRLREFHSRRWFGDLRRVDGFPWASSGLSIRRQFADFERIPVERALLRSHGITLVPGAVSIARLLMNWRKYLYRKPERS